MASSLLRTAVLVATLVVGAAARAAELPIIAKARSYLGTEEALNRVVTIHYIGTVTTNDPADASKVNHAEIDIILQKPDRQRVTTKAETTTEASGIDGYEAWLRVTSNKDASKWEQTNLSPESAKRLRAMTWENLGFYRGIEQLGGSVRDDGPSDQNGIQCRKVAFVHGPGIVFYRYFDVATGKLVRTETESGVSFREEGQMIVDGVRFPKATTQVTRDANGKKQTIVTTFDRILLNEDVPESTFAVPSLRRQ